METKRKHFKNVKNIKLTAPVPHEFNKILGNNNI